MIACMSTHLDSLRDELAIAEGRLRNARDKLESAAKRYGEPLTGMFSDTFFIPRSTAERWLDNAERKFLEKEKQNFAEMQANLRTLTAKKADADEDDGEDTGDPDDPGDEGGDSPAEPTDKGKKKTKKKPEATDDDVKAAEAAAAAFFMSRGAGGEAARDAATARAIIAAGQKRRGEVPSVPDVPQRKPALTIVPGAKPPTDPVAKAILNAGCKRRGEPDVF
jgi:hypothetical protein